MNTVAETFPFKILFDVRLLDESTSNTPSCAFKGIWMSYPEYYTLMLPFLGIGLKILKEKKWFWGLLIMGTF